MSAMLMFCLLIGLGASAVAQSTTHTDGSPATPASMVEQARRILGIPDSDRDATELVMNVLRTAESDPTHLDEPLSELVDLLNTGCDWEGLRDMLLSFIHVDTPAPGGGYPGLAADFSSLLTVRANNLRDQNPNLAAKYIRAGVLLRLSTDFIAPYIALRYCTSEHFHSGAQLSAEQAAGITRWAEAQLAKSLNILPFVETVDALLASRDGLPDARIDTALRALDSMLSQEAWTGDYFYLAHHLNQVRATVRTKGTPAQLSHVEDYIRDAMARHVPPGHPRRWFSEVLTSDAPMPQSPNITYVDLDKPRQQSASPARPPVTPIQRQMTVPTDTAPGDNTPVQPATLPPPGRWNVLSILGTAVLGLVLLLAAWHVYARFSAGKLRS